LTGVAAGDVVLITGCGAMGLFCLQYVKANGGIAVVTGLAKDRKRLDLAKSLGADYAVDVTAENLRDVVMGLTDGEGAEIALELIGSFSQKHSAWKQAVRLFSQGKIVAKPLVTDILPLEQWEEGFRRSFAGEAVKVVFKP